MALVNRVVKSLDDCGVIPINVDYDRITTKHMMNGRTTGVIITFENEEDAVLFKLSVDL